MATTLVVFRSDPHATLRVPDGLDLALAGIAFDHRVSVLFLGAAVLALLPGHDTRVAGLKDFVPGLRALERHGAERFGVDSSALQRWQLDRSALLLPVSLLDASSVAQWMADADVIVQF